MRSQQARRGNTSPLYSFLLPLSIRPSAFDGSSDVAALMKPASEDPQRRSRSLLAPFPPIAVVSSAARSALKIAGIRKHLGGLLMSERMIAAIVALAVSAGGSLAQEVKVGVVLPYTGVGAEFAQQMDRGLELYLKLNADQVKPYTITLIKRDSKAPNGAEAKVVVQELLTQNKVDL
jgi:hypothetical protein